MSKFFKCDYDTSKERKCSIHGVMPIEGNFYACKGTSRHGKPTIIYRCILCNADARAKRYAADPIGSMKQTKKWRKKNPDKLRLINGKYYKVNRVKLNATYKRHREECRKKCIFHYGGPEPKCACCGEKKYEFLVVDHIDGGGNQHRKKIRRTGSNFYKWLVMHDFPTGFRVLYHNCNFSLGAYGYCPHTSEGSTSCPVDPSGDQVGEGLISPS